MRRSREGGDLGPLIVVLVQVLIIVIILFFLKVNDYNKNKADNLEEILVEEEEKIDISEDTNEQQETENESDNSEDIEQEDTEVIYEAPEYDFKTDELTIEIEGLEKEYTFAWVSDVHLITDFEKANDFRIEYVKTVKERDEQLFVTEDGVHTKEIWPEIVKYLNYNEFDGYLFGGDLLDYCSKSNLDYFLEYYNQLRPNLPKLYIRSDHDYGFKYGGGAMTEKMAQEKHAELFEDQNSVFNMILEYDKFVIIGINKSYMNMPDNYLEIIQAKIDEAKQNGKTVIIMTHVPYESKVDDTLAELSIQVRNVIYYWGGDKYVPNEITEEFLKNLYDDDAPVSQVIAGHLHASWDGMISENVSEHIFSPAYSGVIGIIHIVPKERFNE